jgi:putative FmdB family regulatory protein
MPIYAFECADCGHNFDRLQKLSDPDPSVCPECGAERVRRQLTAPQFRLAGGGWYETDFKKDGDKKRNLADKACPEQSRRGEPAAKSDSGSDSKPATKPEPAAAGKSESKPSAPPATTP